MTSNTFVQRLWIKRSHAPMNLLDRLLRRAAPIQKTNEITEFIAANAAFVVQKGIYEYARARAGHYAKVLFGEEEFKHAVEVSRWRAYPLGLAMVGEVAANVLEEVGGLDRIAAVRKASALTLAAFDKWDVPAVLGADTWRDLREQLVVRLDRIGLHPMKRVMDIPEPTAEDYFALMPIHESLRGQDFPTLKSYLKVTLCNVHAEMMKRIDADALKAALTK
jgi:hypothetical protein